MSVKKYTLELIEEGIVLLQYFDGVKSDLAMEKDIMKRSLELSNGGRFYNIIAMKDMLGSMTDEAMEFSAKDEKWAHLRICDAIFTNSLVVSFIVGTYIKIYKPITPTQVFNKYEDALAWAKKLKVENQELIY